MKVKIITKKDNLILRRKEISFQVTHDPRSTPSRREIKATIAKALKVKETGVFLKKFETLTGTHVASGTAHIYDSIEHAKLIEPKYVIERNKPPEKPIEGEKE